MKKIVTILCISLLFITTGCAHEKDNLNNKEEKVYKQADGKKVNIPKNPQRIAVLTPFYVGDFIKLGIKPVAVLDWTKDSNILKPYLKKSASVGENDVEEVAKQKPDLIITDSRDKNIKKYNKIAPTIAFGPTDYNYKEIIVEVGKITNNKKQAQDWVTEWEKKTKKDKEEIQAKTHGATASIFEPKTKEIYIYGQSWGGRGLEIIHGAFGMPMNEPYKQKLNKEGYHTISKEEIDKLSGDYLFLSESKEANFDFKNTNAWKNIDAVKNNKVFEYRAEDYWFTDPITLENLRGKLKKEILSK